jgi:hypothetical protein
LALEIQDAAYANVPGGAIRDSYSAPGGGIWLDHLFDQALQSRIEQTPGRAPTPLQVRRLKARVMAYWEDTIKREFLGHPIANFTRRWTDTGFEIMLAE